MAKSVPVMLAALHGRGHPQVHGANLKQPPAAEQPVLRADIHGDERSGARAERPFAHITLVTNGD